MQQQHEHQELLDAAVLGLFRKPASAKKPSPSVFLTTLYSDLEIVWESNDPDLVTAATNGIKLWINPAFFKTLSPLMRVTLLAHELWHIAYLHMERVAGRDFKRWNEACDHAINLTLKEYGYTFDIPHLADTRFVGMSAEQIYEILMQENQPINLPFGGDITPLQNDGDSESEGSGLGAPLTDKQIQQVTSSIVRAVTMSRMGGDQPGSLPSSLETKIDRLLNPKLPWFRLLRRWFQQLGEMHFSLRMPNRRHHPRGMYLPGIVPDNEGLEHIMWAADSSGSVDDEQLKIINSEISGVQKTYNPEKMTVVAFDTQVHTILTYEKDEKVPPLSFQGRGGTDLEDLFAYAKKVKPTALVVFSDLFVRIPPNPGIPILWICLDNPGAVVPYGTLLHMKSR